MTGAAIGSSGARMSEEREFDVSLAAPSRDALGHFCFWMHFAVMAYIVLGWLVPWRPALLLYLIFIPAVYAQWQLNKDTCILNNIEGWLRTGRWYNKHINPEEGAWLLTLIKNVTGIEVTARQTNFLSYAVFVLGWLLALTRVLGWF